VAYCFPSRGALSLPIINTTTSSKEAFTYLASQLGTDVNVRASVLVPPSSTLHPVAATMHQQSRHPPRVSSPASSPQTNPTRTNNQREATGSASRSRAGSEAVGQEGAPGPDSGDGGTGPSRESVKKLDQIIQVCSGSLSMPAIEASG